MKNMKALTIVIGLLVIAGLGYFLYTSMQQIGTEQVDYDFKSAEPIVTDEFDEINASTETSTELETSLDILADLDFEEPVTEENFESTIEANAESESDIESELADLEALDF